MKTLAAVLVELGRPLELLELEIPPLNPGQVLVEVAYSGVCHTQLGASRGIAAKTDSCRIVWDTRPVASCVNSGRG